MYCKLSVEWEVRTFSWTGYATISRLCETVKKVCKLEINVEPSMVKSINDYIDLL